MSAETTTEKRVAAMLAEARKSPTQTWRPRFSSAGDCRRKLVYEASEAKAGRWPVWQDRPFRWNAASACGTAIGALLEQAAVRAGADAQVEVQIDVIDEDLRITGTADIVWPDAVWDIKWLGEFAFRQAQKQADPKHLIQVQGYAGVLNKPRWALICFPLAKIGKGLDFPFYIHEGDTPENASNRIVEVWQDVAKHVAEETVPERDYAREKCELLRCPYREPCWKEAA